MPKCPPGPTGWQGSRAIEQETQISGFARARRAALALITCLLAIAALAAPVHAAETIESFDTSSSSTQAGGHPDLQTSFTLANPGSPESVKDLIFNAPSGILGDANAIPTCTAADFALEQCPVSSQAGLITVHAAYEGNPSYLLGTAPLYDLEPAEKETARFGLIEPTADLPVSISVALRTGSDYGLRFSATELSQAAPLAGAELTLWGYPAAASHDAERFPKGAPGSPAGCPGLADTSCLEVPTASSAPVLALTQNPSTCAGPINASLDADSHQHPGTMFRAESSYPALTECQAETFDPVLSAIPTTTEADSSTGLAIDLRTPGRFDGLNPAPSEIKAASFRLPAGLGIDAAALASHAACSEAQAKIGSEEPAGCPLKSKLGSARIEAPALSDPLEGAVYNGGPASGESYSVIIAFSGFGINAKLLGTVGVDPQSGQIEVNFPELPQVSFADLHLELSPGLLLTPRHCGFYEIEGAITPWDSELAERSVSQSFGINSGKDGAPCVGPATKLALALSPASITADGASLATATATLNDAGGHGVSEEHLAFSSSDAGERIGPVIDHGDGTYSAQITSSTTVGKATITATDTSTQPALSETVILIQTGEPSRPPPPVQITPPPTPAPPLTTLAKKPPHRSEDPTPTIRFASAEAGVTFTCKIDQRPYRPCRSPITLAKLSPGPHSFSVRATDSSGITGKPALDKFVIASPGARR